MPGSSPSEAFGMQCRPWFPRRVHPGWARRSAVGTSYQIAFAKLARCRTLRPVFASIFRIMASESVNAPAQLSLPDDPRPSEPSSAARPTGAASFQSLEWILDTGLSSSSAGLPALHNTMAVSPDHLQEPSLPAIEQAPASEPGTAPIGWLCQFLHNEDAPPPVDDDA
jgi:hypothetical protein